MAGGSWRTCSAQGAVLGAMVGSLNPGPETVIQLFHGERLFRVEVSQELIAQSAEVALDFAAAFGLIGRGVHDQSAERGGNAGQLLGAINLGIVDVEPGGHTTGRDGLAQTIERGIESLAGIELGMRDEAAGVIQGGVQEGLHLAAAGALDVGTEQHVGLPDLIAGLGFELLVGGRDQQLALGETALLEEAVQRGGGDAGSVLARRQSQFAQQGGAGTVRVFALQAFNEIGELRGQGARLAAVLPRFGRQGLETISAVAEPETEMRLESGMS